MAENLLKQNSMKTPREHDPEMPRQSKVNGLPRYQHQEKAAKFSGRSIWVESRESALAPVGEGFLFKTRNNLCLKNKHKTKYYFIRRRIRWQKVMKNQNYIGYVTRQHM